MFSINLKHIYAIIYRRMLIHKRSKSQLIKSSLMTIGSSVAALSFQYVMNQGDKLKGNPINFRSISSPQQSFAIITSKNLMETEFVNRIIENTEELIYKDTNFNPYIHKFYSTEEFDNWSYYLNNNNYIKYNKLLFTIEIFEQNNENIITIYNNVSGYSHKDNLLLMNRILYKDNNNNYEDLQITPIILSRHISSGYVSMLIPSFITFGVLNICMLFVSQAIEDVSSERRPYLLLSGLSLTSYWFGCFIADLIVWILTTSIFWLIYILSETPLFILNKFESYISLILSGPGFILLVYCISFAFSSPETGSNYAYFFIMIPFILLGGGSNITPNEKFNKLLSKIQMLYPVTNLFQLFNHLAIGKFQFELLNIIPFSLLICIIMLCFIEWTFLYAEKNEASLSFSNYKEEFLRQRSKNISIGAKEMEDLIKNNKEDFILKIIDVCRHFFTSKRKAIPAVNHINLGIKKGEVFGLLGANGAGKTTLMKIISGRLPLSHGKVLINNENSTNISFCPQFEDHLSPELTGIETFKFYSMIFNLPSKEFNLNLPNLIKELDLQDHAFKCISEMSGGNIRKVSVGISFLSPAPIIMLDEPTSSLDPIGRHKVHDLINKFKGEKTFILCTHLLNEAENLCDTISIMIKGCIYTVGSPQLLSNYYGKDWKIDLLLTDLNLSNDVENYINENIPNPILLFKRQRSRVYSVSCNNINLTNLFSIMQKGIDLNIGIQYFTCSSSTLEKVFMELIKMAENNEEPIKDDSILL